MRSLRPRDGPTPAPATQRDCRRDEPPEPAGPGGGAAAGAAGARAAPARRGGGVASRRVAPSARSLAISPAEGEALRGWVVREGAARTIEAGLASLVEHHAEESQLALPRMLGEGRRFDLAFVDGNHRFDGVFLDLVYLGRLLRPGAVVFLDDYQLPAVARAASFFLRNLAWALEEVSPADALHQWAVLRASRTTDERPFDFYVEF